MSKVVLLLHTERLAPSGVSTSAVSEFMAIDIRGQQRAGYEGVERVDEGSTVAPDVDRQAEM